MPATSELRSGLMPKGLRRPVESAMGVDLTDLRLDTSTDPRQVAGGATTIAAFDGRTIHTGPIGAAADTPFGREVLAHELVHAAQLRAGAEIDGASRGRLMRPLKMGWCGSKMADATPLLRSGAPLSPADAKKVLDHYESLGGPDRDKVVIEFHKVGTPDTGIQRLLAALSPAELTARSAVVADMQERVQRLATQQTSGMTGDQLAAAQGTKMKTEAEARALAAAAADAKAKALPPPKTVAPADIAREQNAETKRTSPITATVTNAWDALAPVAGAQAAWDARAAAVIPKIVAACTAKAPGLGIKASNIKWAPREVAERGANVYAFSGDPISIGMRFVETSEADPEYAVSTVVHEIVGHPQFGDRFKSYEAQIYAEAHAKEPSLGAPWDTKEEKNTFGYIGTEIYAALRGFTFEKASSPAHAKAGLVRGIDAESNIDNKIGLLKSKYEATVGASLLQGLYERFRIDPRIDPTALALFVKIAEKHFPKVLKK